VRNLVTCRTALIVCDVLTNVDSMIQYRKMMREFLQRSLAIKIANAMLGVQG
jgi:hypothetical protein